MWIGIALVAAGACAGPETNQMQALAEQYVKLVLAVGQHDADYVDAFYGPPEWRTAAVKRPLARSTPRRPALRPGWRAPHTGADPLVGCGIAI